MTKLLKYFILYVTLFIISTLTVQVTVSYLKTTHIKNNELILGTVIPKIIEEYDEENSIGKNVRVKNIGNSPIYIRASIIYYFKDKENNIIGDKPILNNDYIINFSNTSNWIKLKDGYFYYKVILYPGNESDNIIDLYEEINKKTDKSFALDIAIQAIQATPNRAVIEAWGIDIVNGELNVEGE